MWVSEYKSGENFILINLNGGHIVDKIKSPLLIVHGEKDNIIDINFGKKVFEFANQPKESLFVKNAGHNDLFDFDIEKKIFSFLENQINY